MSAGVDLLAMDTTRLTRQDPNLAGLHVLVVGAGKSGLAAARLAAGRGAHVTLCDRQDARRLANASREAGRLKITLHCGGHSPELADGADLLVVSPGVPASVPLLERARERGLPVWGEVELAARFCRGRIVGVTGSNGKSTVTTMVGGILRGAGIAGGTGGNLDRPLSDLLEHDAPDAWHALELSSFQLETVETLRADVAVMLNLSADHLDRHATLEAYAQAKMRLLELQSTDDYAVLNADDAESARFSSAVRGRLHLFSTREAPAPGAYLQRGRLTLDTGQGEDDLLDVGELPVPGAHNVSNALAAALACRLAGCTPEAITRGLREYRSLPHRLELVGQTGGVRFYNDSKATNPASAACALAAFPAGTVHLILGGRDKQADWDALVTLVRSHAKRVLLVGEAATQLERLLEGTVPLRVSRTVPRAVEDGLEQARPGDVLLLAPGCASFDQYTDFAARGEDFRKTVLARIDRDPGACDG